MLVVKLPTENKNAKLSFAHFNGIPAKISVQQNNDDNVSPLNFE
jgi:hypothetical protein